MRGKGIPKGIASLINVSGIDMQSIGHARYQILPSMKVSSRVQDGLVLLGFIAGVLAAYLLTYYKW